MSRLIIPVKRLISNRMKLFIAAAICLGIFYIATANIIADESQKSVFINSLKSDGNGNLVSTQEDVADINSLRLIQVMFRHGDRTPIDKFPKDPYNSRKFWPEGWGKLTTRGKQMQYSLGQYIRRRYDGYLSRTYVAEEIFVQSSDKDRTIQSAMANLAGMWPPTSYNLKNSENIVQQFVPVHTISESLDNKIAFTKSCPKYEKLLANVPYLPSEKEFNLENEELYRSLSEHTGLRITSYHNVSDVYDTLFVQKCHNLTLPEWTKELFPGKLQPFAERWLKATAFTEEMLRLKAGPLVTDIIRNMKRVMEKPSDEVLQLLEVLFHTPAAKLFVYSGHDTTLSPMLDALGLFNGKIPPYAASLYFELHEISGNYFVKVFYRPDIQKPAEEKQLQRCSSNPCRFEDFMKSMDPFILDEKQWAAECQD